MFTVVGNRHSDLSSILGEIVCISHSGNTFGKNESNYSSSRYGYIVGQTAHFNFGMVTGLGKGKV